ncbi:Pathogenesis-related protein 1 [Melia azedarach]|uniref:Pathogenesis-related protein 1 n=1 Tax=Melia azedarach TaxID=155640 RepID=A0ACC1XZB5_MELAZ|nr:Pathogenesis-related protein 1 [Melia azedarach]
MGLCKNISPLSVFYLMGFALLLPSHSQDSPQDFVDAHNAARQQVGVGPVTWDDKLAAYARNYANQRSDDCDLIHSSNCPYGENLALSSGDLSATKAVNGWVDEKAYYNYDTDTCATGKTCGHYIQVVWLKSVRIGCAKVRCKTGGTFIGCNYDPRGNHLGQKPY